MNKRKLVKFINSHKVSDRETITTHLSSGGIKGKFHFDQSDEDILFELFCKSPTTYTLIECKTQIFKLFFDLDMEKEWTRYHNNKIEIGNAGPLTGTISRNHLKFIKKK